MFVSAFVTLPPNSLFPAATPAGGRKQTIVDGTRTPRRALPIRGQQKVRRGLDIAIRPLQRRDDVDPPARADCLKLRNVLLWHDDARRQGEPCW